MVSRIERSLILVERNAVLREHRNCHHICDGGSSVGNIVNECSDIPRPALRNTVCHPL